MSAAGLIMHSTSCCIVCSFTMWKLHATPKEGIQEVYITCSRRP